MNKIVDSVAILVYNKVRYRNLAVWLSWIRKMVKHNKRAALYEHAKIIGGLVTILTIVIGIAINVFTLPQRMTAVETKILQSETRITLIESKLDSLIHDNKEIKADIKELLKKRGN